VPGRMLGGCGRMLGGGGGVRAPNGDEAEGASGWAAPGTAGAGVAGRERTGGGGGPELAPGMDGGAERTGAGGGPPGVGRRGAVVGTGAARGGSAPGGEGEMPGRVPRGICGAIEESGRGGENEGRGGTADAGWTGGRGPRSLGLSFSLMLRALATISKT
jgi:hypothetical protein